MYACIDFCPRLFMDEKLRHLKRQKKRKFVSGQMSNGLGTLDGNTSAELTESEDMLLHPQTSLKHMHTHIDMQTNKHLKHETNINCDIYKNMF